MKTNTTLIRLSIIIMVIFGGTFTFRYFRAGELLLDQIVGVSVGLVLLIASLIWRKINLTGEVSESKSENF
ncbi:hypothetical protein [Ureibacillus sinduriensis]|uniref:Uncharacterized protein n=1 Tax=Ureibacillus sinduriensis BLB-1 = JCM 15800 TaxID=1384057 RepID=A0A0A3IXB2_9BACL|nr:hypothetical protein [Ureibacillus sinduriensis]KGR79462.1 hypothetical protein CD33_00420 [Ureibacillus sinduriensis BLB-1 = JCM 15800]